MTRTRRSIVVSVALSACLALTGVPASAIAETSDELKAELATVQAHLDELYGQAEQVSEDLNETRVRLDDTQTKIEENTELANQKAAELTRAKRTLAGVVAEDYKGGDLSMLSIILGSRSIEEFVSNLYYANKVSAQREEVIANVKTVAAELAEARGALEQEKVEQQELLGQQEQLQAELDDSINAAQDYVDSLSVQIQEALAAEEAARQEAARREAEAAAAAAAQAAAEAAARQQESAAQVAAPASSGQTSSAYDYDDYSGGSSQSGGESSSSGSYGGQISGSVASTVIGAAVSQVGCAYVYGACSPGVAFDCSGLVMYAYACAGYSVPHSSGSLRAYCNKPISQAVPGDIVWRSGHVGIYIGGGTTVEAFYPGAGVGYGSVGSFLYAGSPAA